VRAELRARITRVRDEKRKVRDESRIRGLFCPSLPRVSRETRCSASRTEEIHVKKKKATKKRKTAKRKKAKKRK
jgi:hypothetical protein